MNPAVNPTNKRYPTLGDLRNRLTLEAPVRTSDGAGGATRSFSAVAEVWADIRTQGGHESLDADRLGSRISHAVWIRYRDDVLPDHRFRLGNRIFEIRSVIDHDGRHLFLECQCEEFIT